MNSDKCPCGREYKTVHPFNGDELRSLAVRRCTSPTPCWRISDFEEIMLKFKKKVHEENKEVYERCKELEAENTSLKARIDELEEIESNYELISTQLDSIGKFQAQLAGKKRRRTAPVPTPVPALAPTPFGSLTAPIGFFESPAPAFPRLTGGFEWPAFGNVFGDIPVKKE